LNQWIIFNIIEQDWLQGKKVFEGLTTVKNYFRHEIEFLSVFYFSLNVIMEKEFLPV